ncbi:MAG: hypothetical protein ACM3QY_06485, partial [Candidatus Levyibacteriota bacterium]
GGHDGGEREQRCDEGAAQDCGMGHRHLRVIPGVILRGVLRAIPALALAGMRRIRPRITRGAL